MSSSPVIDKYFLLIFEYFHIMQSSTYVESLGNPNIIQVGWNATSHIYKIALINLKNTDEAFQKAQKGMYCFLEYIEQLSKQMLFSIEPLEATVFVYDKVLAPISNSTTPINTINAIGSADMPKQVKTIESLDYLTKIMVFESFQEFTLTERIRLIEESFYKFANMFLGDTSMEFDSLFKYLEMSKQIMMEHKRINLEEWSVFLQAFYRNTKRAIKQKTVPTDKHVDEKCLALKMGVTFSNPGAICREETEEIAKFAFL